jgi:hypothetical protein
MTTHNYETVKFDIAGLEKCASQLQTEKLKRIAQSACENLSQIAVTIALPHFLMKQSILSVKHFQYLLEGAVATKNVIRPKSEEAKKKLADYVDGKFKENEKVHSEEAREALNKLRVDSPFIDAAIQTQALNSLVNIWTIFESTSKDIWILLMNEFQSKFLNNILDSKTDNEIDGITGKQISISLLGKYGFNVNHKLGEILSFKYDFTSCTGIKKAFIDLNKANKDALMFLDNQDLFKLELIRNLIVHKAGRIDEEFIKKAGVSKDLVDMKIIIDPEQYEKYDLIVIESLIKLFQLSDELCK